MLDLSLILIIGVFCVIMFGVLAFCLRMRRRSLADEAAGVASVEKVQAADTRVAVVLFGAIIVGAMLALLAMYLIFFRSWN